MKITFLEFEQNIAEFESKIEEFYEKSGVQTPGVEPQDITKAIQTGSQ